MSGFTQDSGRQGAHTLYMNELCIVISLKIDRGYAQTFLYINQLSGEDMITMRIMVKI